MPRKLTITSTLPMVIMLPSLRAYKGGGLGMGLLLTTRMGGGGGTAIYVFCTRESVNLSVVTHNLFHTNALLTPSLVWDWGGGGRGST